MKYFIQSIIIFTLLLTARAHSDDYRYSSSSQQSADQIRFIWIVLMIILTIGLLVPCCQRRSRRKRVQEQMQRKQMEYANMQGISVHELLQNAGRPNTLHV